MRQFIAFLFLLLLYVPLSAKVIRLQITERTPILNGSAFAGIPYELIKGTITFGLDPDLPQNQRIVDLDLAPRNEAGLVEAWTEFVVLQAIDSQQRSQLALVEVSNRGGKFIPRYFLRAGNASVDPDDPESFGDGLLMEVGMTLIWLGWQWDVPEGEGLKLHVPIAKQANGQPLSGWVRSDWRVDELTNTLNLGHRNLEGYPVADPDDPATVLTRRSGRLAPREVVLDSVWAFAQETESGLQPNREHIFAADGFAAGYIYELVYRAYDPPVVGMGLAAIRDIISYAKYDSTCPFPVEQGIAAGVSQTGRFLRMMLYQGFNEAENGQKAYDGMMIITAGAGRGSFNHRFAQPSRDAHRYSAFFYPTDLFPFSSHPQSDRGAAVGWLDQTTEAHRPYIFSVNTGYEYWGRAAALIHSDIQGETDVPLLPEERVFHLASGQHFVNGFPPQAESNEGVLQYYGDPLDFSGNYRALMMRLVDWVQGKKLPPASRYPTLGDGTLVSLERLNLPGLPGLERPLVAHEAYRADYGPRWEEAGIVDQQPPILGEAFPVRIPQVDPMGTKLTESEMWSYRCPWRPTSPGMSAEAWLAAMAN
ncbi:MAG: alpha/beta hydrolase domain-containing protein [Bacteroidota bacterium]